MNEVHPINEEAWEEWVEFRQVEKKIKIGPMAEKKQKKLLSQYPPPIQQEIIDTSIMNSYQGLFAPKGGNNGQTGKTNRGATQGNQHPRRLSQIERTAARREQLRREQSST